MAQTQDRRPGATAPRAPQRPPQQRPVQQRPAGQNPTGAQRSRQARPGQARPGQNRPQGQRPGQAKPVQRKAPLSLEERQRRAAAREEALERAREAREIRRFRRKRLFLLSFLLALVFTAGYFAFRMATISRVTVSTKGAYGVQLFRENEKNAVKTYTVKETYFNKSTYLPLDALQEFVTVTESGDEHHRSLILPNGDQVTFDLGTPNCTVNGVRASLEAPVFLKDDVLYLPVDFFSRWMNCFTYTFSSPLDAYVLSFSGDVTPALTTRAMNATPKIDVAAKPATTAPAPAENPA